MWRSLIFVTSTLVGVLCNVVTIEQTQEVDYQYDHHTIMDNDGKFHLYWSYYEDKIFMEMKAEADGWISIGISPNGGMNGADMAIGWVTTDGEAKLLDTHGVGHKPVVDKISNLHLQGGTQEDGWTSIKFWRKLNTCDKEEDREINEDTLRMIWAYGTSDISPSGITHGDYHGRNRGARSLIILSNGGIVPEVTDPDATYKTLELFNHEFDKTHAKTYYNCKTFEMPKLDKKHHIVKIEAVIEPGNEQHLHHMLLFRCSKKLVSKELGEDHHCFSYSSFHDYGACITILVAWAIGGSNMILPEHVGFPIGDDDSPEYVLLETHYDNPHGDTFTDSSGFRITYTDKLREYDADILSVGHRVSPFQIIPPQQSRFTSYGVCPHECTDWGMEEKSIDEINIFGSVLHSHTIGKSLELKHIRSGVELPPVSTDAHYDFNYQELRYHTPEIKYKSGDSLQMVCHYDSLNRRNVTNGGLGTNQEMCLAFVLYYPKLKVSICESRPEEPYIFEHFGLEFKYGRQGFDLSSHTVSKDGKTWSFDAYLNQVQWTKEDAQIISQKDEEAELNIFCHGMNTSKDHRYFTPEKITVPYVKEEKCETDGPGGSASKMFTKSPYIFLSLLLPLLISLF